MERKEICMKSSDAVSPVVGVMLMLVVTVIIAAVVSAFSGGLVGDQSKVPQATIKGTFSITDGMQILHLGGDPLPMHQLVFTIWDGPTFGPDVEKVTRQVLNVSLLCDANGERILGEGGTYNKTSFKAGDLLSIGPEDCSPERLQPSIVPSDYTHEMGLEYTGTFKNRWALCLKNPDNLGQEFMLTVSDSRGNLIAKTEVTVTA